MSAVIASSAQAQPLLVLLSVVIILLLETGELFAALSADVPHLQKDALQLRLQPKASLIAVHVLWHQKVV